MKVYALIGKSGTGKSFQAISLSGKRKIPAIIDDGLLIYDSKVMEGKSAKRVETKIGAIKTALFVNEEQKNAMIKKIKEINTDSILILGTSEGMVEKIVQRLQLPDIHEKIFIEDITTKEQRETARKQREELGKHVIPVPTGLLKKDFSGYFLHPIRVIRGFGFTRESLPEKTVVRPTYSYIGEFYISDRVISDIVYMIEKKNQQFIKVNNINIENRNSVIKLNIEIIIKSKKDVLTLVEKFQKEIKEKTEFITAFNIAKVNVEIKDIASEFRG